MGSILQPIASGLDELMYRIKTVNMMFMIFTSCTPPYHPQAPENEFLKASNPKPPKLWNPKP